ncbi:hypothetical protein A3J19_04940 [Candidatus Daviesbacteria bacterium RIFCSPLOWO2_02_FULL_41_8]|uniref:DUF3899 domain-containing protein n=3 Tax=Candidatus Daviesiibacteriota TaxID=1752718 RepID=A0A1F5NHE4_9BACT|nr:MAG: hypothetical protein A2871_02675 [Candidatus Daviesbacteria bacterium RIFCSPHIGHO2_01_FULL_41_23]OGE33814.1 MAG: hypothetical protein A3D83_04550 [Candidatus Daviesbacteria bacterium RIFCSPHIGHO2_02_FULL_41_10]OGE62081.1 MAG: hypothetical protein A2967_00290 [Candidatus Daviesbacteria bacterium RIFCSPLOWO2_01_FULL_41_32]OGE77045.1 MAG: hypothetical protein A3J19_04940 [Candidatus Daviesbacteria bacterium RIFCSPLOWO2_02_FULL_41_8]
MEKLKPHSETVRIFFFWSGIIATFCYRAIVVINNYSHFWTQIFWYIGTVGFIIYFAHRYQISEKRAKLIKKYGFDEKLKNLNGLSEEEKDALKYIFNTLQSSKEKWNFIFIFVLSLVALILGIYLDFIK